MKGGERAGYFHGLRQPGGTWVLRTVLPPALDAKAIDGWLHASFGIEVGPVVAHDGVAAVPTDFVWRVLHLAAALLRAVKVPVFEAGRILVTGKPSAGAPYWSVGVATPRVDLVAERVHTAAYEVAGKALLWMAGRASTAASRDELFAKLQDGFVGPWSDQLGGAESTVPVLQAAFDLDIPFRHLGSGIFQLGWGSAGVRMDRGAVQFDSAIGSRMVQDKGVAASTLHDAGLPGPVHVRCSREDAALEAAHSLGWPVVVKPVDRDRGEGVTVDVDSDAKLLQAFAHAKSMSRHVLVERQVPGVCHRIVVARDQVIIVSRRLPKGVWGNGEHTVEALVAQANTAEAAKPPWDRLKPFPLDATAVESLAAAGLSPQSVPAAQQFAPLRRIQSSREGGVVDHFTDTIHPENVEVALRAARLFGLALAGVDMISADITRPWHENGAILNEVNYSSLMPSRHSAKSMPGLLAQFVRGDARVPVELVIGEGDAARAAGEAIQARHVARGLRCYLAAQDSTRGPDGEAVSFAGSGLFARCIALAWDDRVEAMVAVVQSDAWLASGSPFDRFAAVTVATDSPAAWIDKVRALVAPYVAAPSM